jgi:hypothetical protein
VLHSLHDSPACVLQVAVSSGGGQITLLEVSGGSIREAGSHDLQAEVACMDMSPIGECLEHRPFSYMA